MKIIPLSTRFLMRIACLLLGLTVIPLQAKPNVLFLSVDDLKPVLGAYGNTEVLTPQIDRLAKEGAIMLNNHCQQAICAPSRMSMFTGLRPDSTKVWDLRTNLVDACPDAVTMQEQFKRNGYQTAGAGKTMHGSDPTHTNPSSWTIPYTHKPDLPYAEGFPEPAYGFYQGKKIQETYTRMLAEGITHWKEQRDYMTSHGAMPAVERIDVPDDAYMDGALATWANGLLEQFKKSGEPFFITVGFTKPHLPFVAPKKYWDLYEQNEIPLAEFRERAQNSPSLAYHNFGELRSYSDVADSADIDHPLDPVQQRELIQGYYACTSYVDAQIGKILDKLEELQLADNTIVVLWGDHGYHLGDHGLWNKHSNFEQATRAPLIFVVPGIKGGVQVKGPTEFVDIYPTLLELCGLEPPYELAGKSLAPALKDPDTRVKEFAVSQYPRGKDIMGYALRNDRYRLVMWIKGGWKSTMPYNPELLQAVELYDYENDPLEKVSQAENPEFSEIRAHLEKELLAFFESQVTPTVQVETGDLPVSNPGASGQLVDIRNLDLSTLDLRFSEVEKTESGDALIMNFEHSPKWPSVEFSAPEGGLWDLSSARGLEMVLVNQSTQTVKTAAFITVPEDTNANRKRYGAQKDIPAGKESALVIPFDGNLDVSRFNKLRVFVNKTTGPVSLVLKDIRVIGGAAIEPVSKVPAPAAVPPAGKINDRWIDIRKVNAGNTRLRFTRFKTVADGKSLQVDFELSPKWPSIDFLPENGGVWDLSAYKAVEIELTNTGSTKARAISFITNEGDTQQNQKRSTGDKSIPAPGESVVLRIPLTASDSFNPAEITSIKLFTGMHTAPVQFRIDRIEPVK